MNCKIIGEDEMDIGTKVTDNNEIEHQIEMHKVDGSIYAHEQDGYPDKAAKRTDAGNEYVNQARRYAKWHVYRERGYDTVQPAENPDRILAALIAITRQTQSAFDDHFGDLLAKIERHYDGSSVELPFADANPDDVIVYQKDVWVRPDPTAFDPPVVDQYLGHFAGGSDSPLIPAKDTLDPEAFDQLDFRIEAVSEMHYLHTDGLGSERTKRGETPLARNPDATIELVPFDPSEIDSFQHYVVSHLAYQIRDCFLRMGVKPPVAFRATGWGKYRAFHEQKFCPQYESYWNPDETIHSWEPN